MPRYKCKSIAALDIALGGLPAKMQVEADVGTGVSAKTVGELRRVTTWSENLVVTTPQERDPDSAVKISKASVRHAPRRNRRARRDKQAVPATLARGAAQATKAERVNGFYLASRIKPGSLSGDAP